MKSKQLFPKLTEHQIQTQIINYLQVKGFYCQRLNAGKYSMGEGVSRRFVQGVKTGTPDIMAFKEVLRTDGVHVVGIRHPILYFIEVKAGRNKPTMLQTLKMKELEEYGAKCIVAYSLDEVMKIL